MADGRYWGFIFPLIAMITLIMFLFFPTMGVKIDYLPAFYVEDDLLPFGGGIVDSLRPHVGSYPEIKIIRMPLLVVAIMNGIGVIVYSLLMIISTIWVTTSKNGLKKAKTMWLVIIILLISNQVISLLTINMIFNSPYVLQEELFEYELTASFSIVFGMILLIVAGSVMILGYIIAKIAG